MPQTDVCVVNGNGFFEIDPSDADIGLQAAIDSLGSNGGTIDVYAGSSTYTLTETVDLDAGNNIVLRGHGATFTMAAALQTGFALTKANCTLDGLRLLDLPGASAPSGRTFINVSEDSPASPGDTNGLIVRNTRFEVRLSDPDVEDYACLRVEGQTYPLTAARRELLVDGCSFVVQPNSIPRTAFASGTTPYGITCIKTVDSIMSRIVNNGIRGVYQTPSLANATGTIANSNQTAKSQGASSGATSMVWDSTDATLTGTVPATSTFQVVGSSLTYTVIQSGTAGSNQVTVEFYPALDANIADEAAVTLTQIGFYGHLASFCQLTNSDMSLVNNNSAFALYCQAAADGQGTAFAHFLAASGMEGHHSQFSNNQLEQVNAKYVVHGEDAEWLAVRGNMFGRIAGKCQAVVFMDGGNDCDVTGNNFHNVSGGAHGAVTTSGNGVFYSGVSGGLIDGNSFSLINLNKRPIQITNCNNVKRGGNNTFEYNKS